MHQRGTQAKSRQCGMPHVTAEIAAYAMRRRRRGKQLERMPALVLRSVSGYGAALGAMPTAQLVRWNNEEVMLVRLPARGSGAQACVRCVDEDEWGVGNRRLARYSGMCVRRCGLRRRAGEAR